RLQNRDLGGRTQRDGHQRNGSQQDFHWL
ncbi:uncharacterized protein METZ01_LOCUS273610, partial [marine metagenome]